MKVEDTMDLDLKKASAAYLLDYVSGNLDIAEALVIAAHASLNTDVQKRIAHLENLAGALLENSTGDSSPAPDSLNKIFDTIEKGSTPTETKAKGKTCSVLPEPVTRVLNKTIDEIEWTPLGKNIQYYPILKDGKNAAYLMKVAPQTEISSHRHKKTELTLLLQGGLRDNNLDFYRGDLAIEYGDEEEYHHAPVTIGDEPCICLVTNLNAIRLESLIGRTMQSFMKVFR